jgi:hypothetical protein
MAYDVDTTAGPLPLVVAVCVGRGEELAVLARDADGSGLGVADARPAPGGEEPAALARRCDAADEAAAGGVSAPADRGAGDRPCWTIEPASAFGEVVNGSTRSATRPAPATTISGNAMSSTARRLRPPWG